MRLAHWLGRTQYIIIIIIIIIIIVWLVR